MALNLESLEEILKAVKIDNKLTNSSILKQIKEKLKDRSPSTYEKWERNNFNINHSFSVLLASRSHRAIFEVTFLNWAAFRGHKDAVEFLLCEKADPNVQSDIHYMHFLPISLAVGEEYTDNTVASVNAIIDNAEVLKKFASTALLLAAGKGHIEIVKALIDASANVNVQLNDFTALLLAAREGHTEIVKVLINAGANVDVQDNIGKTALHCAALGGHTKIVEVLIEAEADVNKENYYKNALSYALSSHNMDIVELIVNHIAKLEVAGLYVSEMNLQQKISL